MEFLNWFLNPIQNRFADFEGRAGRREFWMFVLVWLIISIILNVLATAAGMIFSMIHALLGLVILIPSLALGARRLHDIGKSGWWQLVGLVPLVGWIVMIVMFALEGNTGPNAYGNPVAAAAPAAGGSAPNQPTDTSAASASTSHNVMSEGAGEDNLS